jgi:hypothetical protein
MSYPGNDEPRTNDGDQAPTPSVTNWIPSQPTGEPVTAPPPSATDQPTAGGRPYAATPEPTFAPPPEPTFAPPPEPTFAAPPPEPTFAAPAPQPTFAVPPPQPSFIPVSEPPQPTYVAPPTPGFSAAPEPPTQVPAAPAPPIHEPATPAPPTQMPPSPVPFPAGPPTMGQPAVGPTTGGLPVMAAPGGQPYAPVPSPPTYDPAAVAQPYSAQPYSAQPYSAHPYSAAPASGYGYGIPSAIPAPQVEPKRRRTGVIVLSILTTLFVLAAGVMTTLFVLTKQERDRLDSQAQQLGVETTDQRQKINTLESDLATAKRDLTDAQSETKEVADQKAKVSACVKAFYDLLAALNRSNGQSNAEVNRLDRRFSSACQEADRYLD